MSLFTFRLLFQYNIKELVIYCINSAQYEKWTLSVIEFITLMYKDPVSGGDNSCYKAVLDSCLVI